MAKKKEASVKTSSEQEQKTQVQEGEKIKALGPSDEKNGATILRYRPMDGRKNPLDIQKGMILNIGEDIDVDEAETLLGLTNWQFERVEE